MKTLEHRVEVEVTPNSLTDGVVQIVSSQLPDEIVVMLVTGGDTPVDEDGFTTEPGTPPKKLGTYRYRRVVDGDDT